MAHAAYVADREPASASLALEDDTRPRPLGVFAAAVFTVFLGLAPFAAAALANSLGNAGAFTYDTTPTALAGTLRALNEQAQRLVPDRAVAQGAWNDMVARELAEGDRAAARGLILSAGAMVGPPAREALRLRASGDEVAAIRAALPLLTPEIAAQAEAAGLVAAAHRQPPAVMGDARDLALQARSWLEGRGQSLPDFVLTGVVVAAPEFTARFGGTVSDWHAAAAALKQSLRSGELAPAFEAELAAALSAVNGQNRLADGLRQSLSSPAALADEPAAVRAAFVAAIADDAAWRDVAAVLTEVAALSVSVGPSGAARLLEHAQTRADLPRLHLIAAAGGDQAVAIAKRQGEGVEFLPIARADVAVTPRMQISAALLALCLFAIIAAPLLIVWTALRNAWRAAPPKPRRAPLAFAARPTADAKPNARSRRAA